MSKKPSPSLSPQSALMLLALGAVWGGSFFFAEVALKEVPSLTITLHRVFWALPVLLYVVHKKQISFPRSAEIWWGYLVMGALNNAIPFSLIFWGQTQIEGGLASILNSTTAMFGAVVAGLLLADEPLTKNKIAGAGLGLLGVVFIIGPEALQGFSSGSLAQLAVLAGAFSYALASVWGKAKLGSQPPLMNALGMLICSTLLMVPVVLVVDGPPAISLSLSTWAALLGVSTLSTAFAYYLYFAILARAGAANLMLVTLLIPPFAIGLGWVFLAEQISPGAWIGFVIIALGFVITDGRVFLLRSR